MSLAMSVGSGLYSLAGTALTVGSAVGSTGLSVAGGLLNIGQLAGGAIANDITKAFTNKSLLKSVGGEDYDPSVTGSLISIGKGLFSVGAYGAEKFSKLLGYEREKTIGEKIRESLKWENLPTGEDALTYAGLGVAGYYGLPVAKNFGNKMGFFN